MQKEPISDLKKYSLLAIAAFLLIGAYFIGQAIDINETYNHEAHAEKNDQNTQEQAQAPLKKGEIIAKDFNKRFDSDYIQGDASDKPVVTLIEYGSLTCPHCAHFHQNTLLPLKTPFIIGKKIQYIYRDYPLDGAALKASLLAKCDITKRSAFIDLLYKKQAEWTRGESIADIEKNLVMLGKMGGLPAEKAKACLNDKEEIKKILTVQKQSNTLFDITATPTIIVNNEKFTGGIDKDSLKNILDHLLKSAKK